MPTLEVQKVTLKKELDFGNVYTVMGLLDGDLESVELTAKPQYAPKIGDSIVGTVEDTQWGKKFKRENTGGKAPYKEDPKRQESIERQNALTNAVAYCTAKALYLPKDKALDELTGKHIIEVAFYFQKFTSGNFSFTPPESVVVDTVYTDEREMNDQDVPF